MSKHKKKKQVTTNERKPLMNAILDLFGNNPTQVYNYKQLAKKLDIDDHAVRQSLTKVLNEMVLHEDLEEVTPGKYKMHSKARYITGKVQMTSSNNAFVKSTDVEDDVFIAQKNLNRSLGGDIVKVYLYAQREGRHPEGEVVEILEQARKQFVGLVEVAKHFAFLAPDSKDVPYDIFIPLDKLHKAKHGDKAVARITDWPKNAKNPIGEIIDVLGKPGSNETEMHAILAEYELPYNFPEEVLLEAEQVNEKITKDEIAKRRDFRDVLTFTIDPADAKDFDDALSYKKLENGHIEVGVHIADVTHYVQSRSLVDDEAYERATSVYLVDRVVPMLPEKLSNNLCSLRPHEDKLCFSAVFELDENAHLLSEWFGRTIINSDRRYDYDEAQQILETGIGDNAKEMLELHKLAQIMRQTRMKSGALEFDRVEVRFEIDEKGKPIRAYFKENKDSNKLIEEFMLLANRKVAEYVGKMKEGKKQKTFVYRIHDVPNMEKLQSFANFIKKFGHKINTSTGKKTAETMNTVLTAVKGKKEENIIENLALRSMAKAIYSTKNIGHYGLAFDYYTHFTSPIRRYPDMMVHRLLWEYSHGADSKNLEKFEKACKHSSEMERRATEAERASIKYKQVEFMSDKIGQEFDGTISGITEWGIYIEINENKCEGMLPIREIGDDYYFFDEENYCLIGKRNGRRFQLGDPLRVRIWRTNLLKKQLDFKLAED